MTTSTASSSARPPSSTPTSPGAPPSCSDSARTTPPSRSTLAGNPAIAYADRVFVTGATGTGKSTLSRRLFLSAEAPRLVVDPADSELTAVPGAVTFSDPRRPPRADTARFVPRDPADRDAYDAVYRWAWEHFPRYVWLDEAAQAAPAQGYPRWLNTYVVQGRKRGLGHLTCHTRPREVARNLIAQAAHLVCFDLPLPDDRRHVAELVGLPPATLDAELARLPRRGFLWWDAGARQLTACPPLDVG